MENRNLEEFKLIRNEIAELKSCVSQYIGFVFAGSGAMSLGLAAIKSDGNNFFTPEIAVILAFFSMLISLVLIILLYKFKSHNRFTGFCKLLTLEQANFGGSADTILSWEVNVANLRNVDNKKTTDATSNAPNDQTKGTNKKNNIGRLAKSRKGFKIILKTIFFQDIPASSWGYPPLVVSTFLFMVAAFLIGSFITCGNIESIDASVKSRNQVENKVLCNHVIALNTGFREYKNLVKFPSFYKSVENGIKKNKNFFLNNWGTKLILVIIFLLQVFVWFKISVKLYELMQGDDTVDRFCEKFAPHRWSFLNKL